MFTDMERKLIEGEMKPGVKYKGYAFINKFKEFCFTPEATGSQAGREKLLKQWAEQGTTIKETKNYIIVTIKESKQLDEPSRARSLMSKFNLIFNFLKNHAV